MRTLFAFAPLFAAVLVTQAGVGALGPLDALSGVAHGFSAREIGLLGSAHFVGFVLGCLTAPALMARAGHARAFAAAAAIGIVATLAHPLAPSAEAWMLFRVGGGFAVAASYTVVESWMQARLDNARRGRVLSGYRMADLIGAVGAQLLIIELEPATYAAYTVVAMIGALSLLPLSLTTQPEPEAPQRPRLRLLRAIALSPLAAAGVFVVGLTNASFRMVGPLYGEALSLSRAEIGGFLAAAMIGGAAAQPLVGTLSDRIDRRRVLIGVSAAALVVCTGIVALDAAARGSGLLVAALLFGAAAMPLYSVSVAHANDFCPSDFVVELNASLLLVFALGAILSPTVAAELIALYGPNALWSFIAAAHVVLIVFGVIRMTRRPSPSERRPYRWAPRTTLIFPRVFKKRRGSPDTP